MSETLYGPHGFYARFWREKLVDGALPLRLNIVAFRTSAVDALVGGFGWRHRGVFGEFAFAREQRVDFVLNIFFTFGIENLFTSYKFLAERNGIAFLPVGTLILGDVIGGIVLGVTS